MARCAGCKGDIASGDDYAVVRIEMWKTTVGSMECKAPDLDKTVDYCVPCAERTGMSLWGEGPSTSLTAKRPARP